eukprot:TRINITY_DN1672_c0_g2_i2.p1 TRINITY_DN1672_c0_g2~~TRINITY_DN1672_c0_g2_i2.p1  ORF type:complete len:381 (-),score=92.33 TRINITY_DN1672_c0_g2_i2:328-1470(-)
MLRQWKVCSVMFDTFLSLLLPIYVFFRFPSFPTTKTLLHPVYYLLMRPHEQLTIMCLGLSVLSTIDPNLAKMNRRVRRGSVSSEATNTKNAPTELKEKKVIPKSEEAMKSIERAIEKNILFKGLDEEQKKDILNAMFEKKVVKDDTIIKQGDEGDNFYVIDSGEFDIYVKIDGNPKKVLTVSSGGSFGELALMYNAPRAATVIATTEGLLWCVDRQTFRAILMDTTSKKRKLYETFLESVPILQTLTKWERYTIADALEPTSFGDGEYIIKQGDSGDLFYIIEKGEAKATKSPSANIAPVEVKKMGVGDYFGEIALLTNEPRAANVIAIGPVKCAVLDAATFRRLMGPMTEILKRNMETYKSYEEIVKGMGELKADDEEN